MDKNLIKKIQGQVLALLPDNHQGYPGTLLTDSCSEVSRLVASWIKNINPTCQVTVIKGVNVCNTNKSHDILFVSIPESDSVYIIDPTIWQFFPDATSILVFVSNDIKTAYEKVKEIYGGQWSKSEDFAQVGKDEIDKYCDIIFQNIQDNLKIQA